MNVILHKDVKVDHPFPKGTNRAVMNKELGSNEVTVWDVTLDPGAVIPLHIHPTHEEAIVILEGTVEAVLENEKRTVTGPATMIAPVGLKHQVVNNSDAPARIIAIFPTVDVRREWV